MKAQLMIQSGRDEEIPRTSMDRAKAGLSAEAAVEYNLRDSNWTCQRVSGLKEGLGPARSGVSLLTLPPHLYKSVTVHSQ
jgi:hypothetical protein